MARKNSPDEESFNLEQIQSFSAYWLERGVRTSMLYSEYGAFLVTVTYKTQKYPIVIETTKASIQHSGYESGVINIVPTEQLSNEKFHLRQTPAFGKFKFRESDGSLEIRNDSTKLKGNFSILISPTGG